eukprot:PhM_4_TR10537/c0_g1_i1/m.18431
MRPTTLVLMLLLCITIISTSEAFPRRPRRGDALTLDSVARTRKPSFKTPPTNPYALNVLNFGAKNESCTNKTSASASGFDNTAPFQAAIDSAATTHGGAVVLVPAGCYHFFGSLTIPTGVTLEGTFGFAPGPGVVTSGSILFPHANKGNTDAAAFITQKGASSTVRGFLVEYPDQDPNNSPIPFPYTFSITGDTCALTDVELLNSYNGVYATGARHYIARLMGQPTNIGLYVDQIYDIGRIENVHWNPWYSPKPKYITHQLMYGRAFVFGRSDWEYVLNTFAFGYAIGYHFIETPTGSCNGNFLGIGMDLAYNASVQVDAAQSPGILITNGEFTAFHSGSFSSCCDWPATHVVVTGAGAQQGPVKFVDSSFWGPVNSIASLRGAAVTTTFSACEFVQWDGQYGKGAPGLDLSYGNLIVTASTFADGRAGRVQLGVGNESGRILISSNIFAGPKHWAGDGVGRVIDVGNSYP